MIDLKLLRENPDAVRASQRARGEDPASSTRCWKPTPHGGPRSRPPTTCAPSRRPSASRSGKASPDERPALLEQAKELAEKVKAAEAEQAEAEKAFTAAHMAISNVIIDGVPAGGEDDFVVLDTVGEPRRHREPEGPPRTRRVARADRHGARRQGVRLAVLLPHRRGRAAAARACCSSPCGWRRRTVSRSMIPPVLVRPEVMAGTGFLGAHADEVYRLEADDLYLVGTSEVPLAGLPRRRDPRPVRRPAALRGLVVVLPPRGGQLRQGHPRHHPRAPVRQGRGLRLLQAGGRRGRTRSAARLAARRCWRRSRCPTA